MAMVFRELGIYICLSLSVLSCIAEIDQTQANGRDGDDLFRARNDCLVNYHMVQGKCQACPSGYFGINCLVPCPYPFFGQFCKHKCNCSQPKCDSSNGCQGYVLDEKTIIKGDCGSDEEIPSGAGCCTNYRKVDGICKACPLGYFGRDCGSQCIFPTFGQFCRLICNCGQSECDSANGCKSHGTTTITQSSTSFDETSVSRSVTTFLSIPITSASEKRKASQKETVQSDDKFTVVLSVTAVSSVIIILTIVITKLRCGTKDTIIYYINRSRRHRPISFHDQFQVPFRNLETDIYMEIEEMDEVDEMSIKSFGNFQNDKKQENEGLKFDSVTKPKPDSLRTREASPGTNVDNILKPKPDTLKHKKKSLKKFEKYKTFTTRRFMSCRVNLKRHNSWHNVIEMPLTLGSVRRAKSYLNIFDDRI